ncbi:MAG: uncharacterized protein KVP18_002238 [Porospora cf. gigantea A]|uniref:uncharacterized protein n=1 Tax=Porospora cf. gigantea A TaxID=2853593 RepID=UPI0035594647|nr:MAG: hypothetical protein KVP18_002238 [Porospora cf. gigantea A]
MRFIAEAGEFARMPKRTPLSWAEFQAWDAQYGVCASVLKTLRRRALRCPFPNVFKEVFQEPEVPVIPVEVESVARLPALIENIPEEGNSRCRPTSHSVGSDAASTDNTIQEFEASLQFPGGPDAWKAPKEGATTTSASDGGFLLVPVAASGEQSLSSSDSESTSMHPRPDSASVAAYLSQWIQLKSATSDLTPFKTPQEMSCYDTLHARPQQAFLQEASPDNPYMHVPTLKSDTEEPPVVAVVQPASDSESEHVSDSPEAGLLSVAIHAMCRLKSSLPRCSPIIGEHLECAVVIQLHLIHLQVSGLSILAATLLHCLLKSTGFLPELSSFLAQLALAAPSTKEFSQSSEHHPVHLEDLLHVIRISDIPEPDIEDVRLEFGREWGRHLKLREEFGEEPSLFKRRCLCQASAIGLRCNRASDL